jgi:hypothetical protein
MQVFVGLDSRAMVTVFPERPLLSFALVRLAVHFSTADKIENSA